MLEVVIVISYKRKEPLDIKRRYNPYSLRALLVSYNKDNLVLCY